MAGSMSLPSVVAVYPAISWRGGLPVSCRRICLAPLSSLRVRALCWWNDVRIFRGGFLASGSGQCRATNGVVRALEEAKPGSKSRRRRNRPVKAVEEALEGQEPVHLAPSDGSVVCVDVVDGGESSSEQSSPLSSENPVPKRKSASRGRRKKVSEVKSSPTLSEGQDAQIEVSQQIVDKSRVVSTNGAAEESVSVSQGANATTGSRRRRRSSAKRDGAAVSASSANSKPAQAGQASEAGVDVNGKALEISDREVESPVISVGGSRRKKNVNSNSQEAAPNGSVATSMNEGGSNSISSAESSAKDASLNSSTNVDNELIHGDRIRNSEVRSVTNGSIPAAQPSIEKKETKKRPRSRRKRGQEAQDVKLLGDEELHTIGQVTALSSINGEVERLEGDEKSGKISEEVVNEGHAGGLTPVDSKTKSDAQTDKENGEPKKLKRAKKPRKKPGAVADLDDNTVDKAQVAQSVLLVETTDSETVSSSGSEDDETAGVHVHPIINQDESVLHTPPELKEPFAGADVVCAADVSPPKRRSRRKRQSESNKKVTAQAAIESESEGSDTPSESGEVKDIEGSSRVQFPAPTWGPQWWDEIQAKSQASISFQDIAERKEVSQEPVFEDTKMIEIKESAEKSTDLNNWNGDSDALHRETRSVAETEKPGRYVKQPQFQMSPSETPDQWSKERMLMLVKPTEEPWLLESIIATEMDEESLREAQSTQNQEVSEAPAIIEEPRKLSPVGDNYLRPDTADVKKEPEVEVEILINTSECTMQRMAILENKKVVEFSIEPVNTKVQVGNIYLGRVKQLLPGMSGVFVDIGGPRLALLDIARNQYPYTFPPVCGSGNHLSTDSVSGGSLQDVDLNLSDEDANFTEEEEEEEEEEDEEDNKDEDEDEEPYEEGIARSIVVDRVSGEAENFKDSPEEKVQVKKLSKAWEPHRQGSPITVNFGRKFSKWRNVEEGMPIIVQVKKESMGKKGPRLTAFPSLAGRFWVLIPRGNSVGVSARITGPERRRLKLLAQKLQPEDLGITVRTEAIGHEQEELERDLTRLMDAWKEIMEKAAAAAVAVERGEEAAVPVLLHREMGQTLTIIRDLFTEKVSRVVVDSAQSFQEVINYLQEVAPHLMNRVVLYSGKVPIFDKFNVESDLDKFFSERVKLPNGGYLVMQETEALVSIDVNGGTGMLGHSMKQREAILNVNLAAAKQIAHEIRLRDIGGIIVVDFIDMDNHEDEKLVYEEMRRAIQRDRSKVSISEISEYGLMEMTRKRVRPSVTYTIHSSCACCKGTGRVEALETTLSKIERAIRRVLADHPDVSSDASTWPQILLRVEPSMLEFLKSWKKKRIIQLGHSLRVWINLKLGMELSHGQFEVTEVPRTSSKKSSAGVPSASPSTISQQEAAVTASVLGKRMWSKRKRFFS